MFTTGNDNVHSSMREIVGIQSTASNIQNNIILGLSLFLPHL